MADDVLLEKIANHYLFYGSFHSDLGLYKIGRASCRERVSSPV